MPKKSQLNEYSDIVVKLPNWPFASHTPGKFMCIFHLLGLMCKATCVLFVMKFARTLTSFIPFFIFFSREKANMLVPKPQEAVHYLSSFMSSKEEISQLGIEPPTCSLRFGASLRHHPIV